MRIAHLTSAHSRFDTRIFLKQCRSLARAGFDTHLIVADGKGEEHCEGVWIHDVGKASSRLDRIWKVSQRVVSRATEIGAEFYHLHDPELMPAGLRLRRMGMTVIFDAHEDLPKQMLGKPYLGPIRLKILAAAVARFERYACARFSAVIGATPFIRDKFREINPNSIVVNNFPLLGELKLGEVDWSTKRMQVAYVGGIAQIRGIQELVAAMELSQTGVRLQLCGEFSESDVEHNVKAEKGWKSVDELGFLDRARVATVLKGAVAGLVTFHAMPNHIQAQPNKMFEYMSAGVPVVASNFPLWKEIVEGNQCGICVDPTRPREIARAIDFLATHPSDAERMGRNGQNAVRKLYNWPIEETRLLNLYRLLSETRENSCRYTLDD